MAHHCESYVTDASPIERFFGSYLDFSYDPSKPSEEQFQSMRKTYRWRRGDAEGGQAWADFRLALVKEFNWLFGTDERDLLAWQNVCAFVGVRGTFETCDDCVRSLKNRHFNLVDLIDARRHGSGEVREFATKEALQEHTRQTASYFPYNHPKAGNLLKRLVRKDRQITMSNVSKAPLFSPPSTRDSRVKVKERKNDMLPVSRKSKKHHRMVAESIEAADTCPCDDFESE